VRFLFLCFIIFTFHACAPKATSPAHGYYTLYFKTAQANIPARLDINPNGEWHILNAAEDIRLDSVVLRNDSFFVKMPLFDSSLKGTWRNDSLVGTWTDHSRVNYSIPFVGVNTAGATCENTSENMNYAVTFSPGDSAESSKGLAVLEKHGVLVTGTVLTETGDYRFLQGELHNDSLWLSAFDGTHLFYLKGFLRGDSIVDGIFLSGNHWAEPWVACKTSTNSLRDPSHITGLKENEPIALTVLNSRGESVEFNADDWKNHVTIIQIMGSWCPNCTDESRFLKTLHDSHAQDGLHIIPVAFERGEDVGAACARVKKQFNELGLTYDFYYGGQAGKSNALKTLPFLEEVHSFPTSIFIDRRGVVRKIFTGFYGPGTGSDYIKHTESIRHFVDSLIAE
jgi:thiol-disulfide isomerase/thioredoxin